MKPSNRTSSCVECKTPIIGDRQLCAACQERRGDEFLAGEVVDDAVTLPRPRVPKPISVWQSLAAWMVIVQLFAVVVIVFILAGRGCR